MKNTNIILSSSLIPVNASLSIRSSSEKFPDQFYQITDERGKTVRKGSISKGICEFYLSVAGMGTGNYRLSIGSQQERFKVI